ncbi:MAG: hypothetical protein Q8N47_28075 [Bryobacterales bacterium]|nr:hypothetical protein [Bryobacterales bacterium]
MCAEGGIILASTRHGEDGKTWAGMSQGSYKTYASFTHLNRAAGGEGAVTLSGSATWEVTPKPKADGRQYLDPTRELGQPPPPTGLGDLYYKIDGTGSLMGYPTQEEADANFLPSGNYYVVERDKDGNPKPGGATGNPITVSGYVTFGSPGDFGDFVIWGGLQAASGGATVKFGPGRYVFAGAKRKAGSPGLVLDASKNMVMRDYSAPDYYGETEDAGAIFIFTDGKYPGLELPSSYWNTGLEGDLRQGQVNIQAGATSNTYVNLHALNPAQAPAALENYKKILFWQDRKNSFVDYGPAGRAARDLVSGHIAGGDDFVSARPKSDAEKTRDGMMTGSKWDSPKMTIQASQSVHLYGVIYQPRGAWLTLIGGNGYSGAMQVITGALDIRGGARLTLQELQDTFTYRTAALVE